MSVRDIMHELLQPGETLIVGGRRGHGKTATSISIVQNALEGEYGHDNVQVITNIAFGRIPPGGGRPVEDYPPGVFHEDTMAGTLRRVGKILREFGPGGCTILWLLDEAQNYMLSDENSKKENLVLKKYIGNARKFDICNVFLTPTVDNLAPRFRCFPTGDDKSGYCTAQLIKDKNWGATVAGGRADPRSITFVRTDPRSDYLPLYIRPTSWVRGICDGAPPGSYGYDTKSMATFSVGENEHGIPFVFDDFMKVTSKGLSHEVPDRIDEYFERWDEEGSDDEQQLPGADHGRIRIADQCRRMGRMRDMGLTWRQIAVIEGEIETTLKSRYGKWSSSESGRASNPTNDDGMPVAGAYIYNLNKEGGFGPLPSSAGGEE